MEKKIPQTFQERINDKTKTPLHLPFIAFIKELAKNNPNDEDEIYAMWRDYTSKCQNYDQSPTKAEFVSWYKLTADEHLLSLI